MTTTLHAYVSATSLASLDAALKSGHCRLVYRGRKCLVRFG